MVTPQALWLDCCYASRHDDLFEVARRRCNPTRITWPGAIPPTIDQLQLAFACIEYDYPDRERLRALPLLRRSFPTLPVLMLTEHHSEALAVWAFRHRVWDYRVKPVTEDQLLRLLGALAERGLQARRQGWLGDDIPRDLIAPSGHLRRPLVAASRTAPALAYISEHYGEPFRIGTVAQLCRLSESEFSRVFHHEQGVSFRRFVLTYRIAMAREFLAEPQASVSQVAYAVGFNDVSHFGRMFRRLVGEPATRYQRRLAATHPSGKSSKTLAIARHEVIHAAWDAKDGHSHIEA